jgi:cell shape-determining protein MreC
MDSWIPTPERLNALCDAALQVEASEKSVEYWREQTSNANKQAGAMREAIRRAVEDLKKSDNMDEDAKPMKLIIADLQQALNERKET